jgi:sarcosine oxidase, subunit gamma
MTLKGRSKMSEPVSALNGARFEGLATVEECGLQGMITLRGDLSARTLKSSATQVSGAKMPGPGRASVLGDSGLCWMSPDELLVLCPYGEVETRLDALNTKLGDMFALAVNVSDARAMFRVSGPLSREVLAKLCPVDMSPQVFTSGMFRRTRMAQVPAAFWMEEDESIRIICFRSVAEYVFGVLKVAAQKGSDVGYFAT